MKKHPQFQQFLQECPVIAILRGITPAEIPMVCDILYQAGIRLLEIPLNSPEPCQSIAAAVRHCGGRQLIGAGTVLSPDDVQAAGEAGSEFILSPNTDIEVIQETVRRQLISIPGFLTPSEGFSALKAGAHYLKFFPAGQFGVSYLRDLLAVMKAPMLAVGGVTKNNMPEFLQVCVGVGIGSALYKPGMPLPQIRQNAEEFCHHSGK